MKRIAVIGAGAVGLSSALHLRRAGFALEVFDPRAPGEGASFGNAGIIAVSEVLPVGRPDILVQVPRMMLSRTGPLAIRPRYLPRIVPWLTRFVIASRPAQVRRISAHLSRLLAQALPAWIDLTRGRPASKWLAARGWLRAYVEAAQVRKAGRVVANLRDLGVAVDILGMGAVAELEPALAPVAGALFFPEAAHLLSPVEMMRALADDARAAGVSFQRRAVARLERAQTGMIVHTEDGSSAFDEIVVAAGAWSRQILRTLHVDLPLDTERGYHLMLPSSRQDFDEAGLVSGPGLYARADD